MNVYTRYYMERERRKQCNRRIVSLFFWLFVFFVIMIQPPKPQTHSPKWQRIDRHGDVITDAELKSQVINQTVKMGAR